MSVHCFELPSIAKQAVTHHETHPSELDNGVRQEKAPDELPAGFPLVFATKHYDQEGDESGELDDGREGEKKATASPHRTEELVVAAVVIIGERPAGRVVNRRAALV